MHKSSWKHKFQYFIGISWAQNTPGNSRVCWFFSPVEIESMVKPMALILHSTLWDFFFFKDTVSLCSTDWPRTHYAEQVGGNYRDPPLTVSPALRLRAWFSFGILRLGDAFNLCFPFPLLASLDFSDPPSPPIGENLLCSEENSCLPQLWLTQEKPPLLPCSYLNSGSNILRNAESSFSFCFVLFHIFTNKEILRGTRTSETVVWARQRPLKVLMLKWISAFRWA